MAYIKSTCVINIAILFLFVVSVPIGAEIINHSELETWFPEPEVLLVPDFNSADSIFSKITFTFSVTNNGPGSLDPVNVFVANPTNRVHQELLTLADYNPDSLNTLTDEWNQQVVTYVETVAENETITYTYEVVAKTSDYDYGLEPDSVGEADDIPLEILDKYTVDAAKYDITNSIITDAADSVVGGETDFYEIVRKLHDFVTDTLHYVLDGKWDDAPQVLLQGHGSCSEYTMLMIALCRAKQIPARYAAGTYLKQGPPYRDEVFHRWTEIYFPNYGWVSVDCTWDDNDTDPYRYFGAISKRLFVTTVSGGDSRYLGWSYNYNWNYSYSGEKPEYVRERYFDWEFYWPAVSEDDPDVEEEIKVFPNPASNFINIQASLELPSSLEVSLYDASGRVVDVIFRGTKPAGKHTFAYPLQDVASGVYFCKFQSDEYVSCKKLVVK